MVLGLRIVSSSVLLCGQLIGHGDNRRRYVPNLTLSRESMKARELSSLEGNLKGRSQSPGWRNMAMIVPGNVCLGLVPHNT